MRRFAVVLLAVFAFPAAAQEGWRVEPAARGVASTVIRTLDDTTVYGFTCFRRRWSFFFHHIAPEGGSCQDAQACEDDMSRVTATLEAEGMAPRVVEFDLFSHVYYKRGDLTAAEMAAMLRAPRLTVRLDAKLSNMWSRPDLALPLNGLAAAIESDARRFDCPR